MVSIYEALKIISENVESLSGEIIPLEESINRVSNEQIRAKFNLPRFDNSAMDGYAIKLSDARESVKEIERILAGESKDLTLESGKTIKIMTGAKVPDGAEAIVPKENTQRDGDLIKLPESIKESANIRFLGEDIQRDELILNDGEIITSAKVAMLSSQGVTHIRVYRRVKVAIFATGEELKLHYEDIESYQIYNSNSPSLYARVKELGADVKFLGSAKDNLESIEAIIEDSLDCDLIVTSGGISVGDADFTREAFDNLGFKALFEKIDIKPGKPTLFGKIGNSYILNLPGNPFASAINFEIFGRAILYRLFGDSRFNHNFLLTKMGESLKIKKGKNTVISGYFDGEFFYPSKKRSPGMVSVLDGANGFILSDRERDSFSQGETIKFIPIDWNFRAKEFKEFITE